MPTNYVMVPVPEEHVLKVMQLVLDLAMSTAAQRKVEQWDEASIETFFRDADEERRSLLSVVARAVLAGKDITDQRAADFMQLGQRETFEILRGIQESVKELNRARLIGTTQVTEPLPNGRLREKRILTMEPDLARMVRTAEKAIHTVEANPLESGTG